MSQAAPERLSQFSTSWTALFQAHDEQAPASALRSARQELLSRYEDLLTRYLRGLLRQVPNRDEAAEDCWQEFALRFLSGRFKGAHPSRGRFRDYVKMALRNLAADYQRRLRSRAGPLADFEPAVADAVRAEADRQFTEAWRDDLLGRALQTLADQDRDSGKHLYLVLKLRMDNPEMRSASMADKLATLLGKPVTDVWVRKRLFLARERFAQLMIAEVRQSLEDTSHEAVSQELADLGLYEYCREFLESKPG